jgi:hypothetical protein
VQQKAPDLLSSFSSDVSIKPYLLGIIESMIVLEILDLPLLLIILIRITGLQLSEIFCDGCIEMILSLRCVAEFEHHL